MQWLPRYSWVVVAMCSIVTAGCGDSGSSGAVDAALSADATDSPISMGGQGFGGAIGKGGAGGTRIGSGGAGWGGIDSGAGGAQSGTGGGIDGGDKATGGGLGSGGAVGLGGKATGGAPSTGGSTGIGGKATGGAPATGGGTGIDGGATGGAPATGGAHSTGGAPATGGIPGVGGGATGGAPGTGGSVTRVCPDSSSYVGQSSWPDKLVVTADARYCGHFKETRNLEQEYAAKAKLTIPAGTYSLANTAGTYDFALPVCFESRPGEPVPAFAGVGKIKTVASTSSTTGFSLCEHANKQPITVGAATSWSFVMTLGYWSWMGAPQPPVWDGSVLERLSSGAVGDTSPGYNADLELCDGADCEDQWQDVKFEACNPDYPLQRHTVVFQGGQVVLDVRITGQVGVAIMLAAFTSASGTLNGQAFTQTDYWKLVYSADHHHFTRNFAVLFDTPIGDACGLKVANFWGNREGAPLPDVSTIRCDLSDLASVATTSATLTQP